VKSVNAVLLYRDDGPLSLALGSLALGSLALGRLGAAMPWLVALIGMVVPSVVASLGLPRSALLVAVVWAVVLGGIGSRNAHSGRVDWLAVPILRTGEYAVIAMAGLAADVSPPLVFALLCAIAFHDYDTVDRVRQGRATDADRFAPLRLLGLGWDGRLLVLAIGFAAGHLDVVFIAGTAYLWTLFAAESAYGWLQRSPA
jgi:hypothetical protein